MVEVYKNNPVVKFFSEVFLMVLAAGILVLIVGWYKHWSRPVDYSNGFFFIPGLLMIARLELMAAKATHARKNPLL